MVAVDNESFIVAGLDSWSIDDAPEIFERRLARLLGVTSFRLPPVPDPENGSDGVRVRRFPDFYTCPECHVLQPFFKFNSPATRARCIECEEDLVPSRFVLACDHGHIEDFPYWKWVHRGNPKGTGLCGGSLFLRTTGNAASLRSVVISCSCGVPDVSMEGAFRSSAMKDLGIRCSGKRPWLKNANPDPCTQSARAMQRGSSSVWHPIMGSALSIPPWGQGLYALIEKEKLFGASDEVLGWFAKRHQALLRNLGATLEDLKEHVQAIDAAEVPAGATDLPVGQAHSVLREEEYKSLTRGNPERHSSEWQSFVCEKPIGDVEPLHKSGIRNVMLVKRLREVRALASFVRGEIPTDVDGDQRHAALSLLPEVDWLPAIEVSGEGVFLRLDQESLRKWESLPKIVERSHEIRDKHIGLLRDRVNANGTGKPLVSPVTPRYLLLHTLAHVLINEWSLDGGYPASALRERLYSGQNMAGLLIYTATSDSAGSLGGLVAQGEPDSLARTLRSALARASWCSNDPLCVESKASGVESVNKAACHACVLLPETSCETNNSFLDRGMLIGAPMDGVRGYFRV